MVLAHALHILSNDVIFAGHGLLLRMSALLASEGSSFTAEAVVLLSTLVLLHISIESIMMSGHSNHIVLVLL